MIFCAPDGLIRTCMPAFVYDLSGAPPTAATVDALARLARSLRRRGCSIRLCHASAEHVELIEFMGMSEVLRVEAER
jgi:hypothetical protein